jgi:hypothetical protein
LKLSVRESIAVSVVKRWQHDPESRLLVRNGEKSQMNLRKMCGSCLYHIDRSLKNVFGALNALLAEFRRLE